MPVMIRSAENGPEGRPRRLAPTPVQAYLFPKATLHKHIKQIKPRSSTYSTANSKNPVRAKQFAELPFHALR